VVADEDAAAPTIIHAQDGITLVGYDTGTDTTILRSKQQGQVGAAEWTTMATLTGTFPVLSRGPMGIEYCVTYLDGTGLIIRRSVDHFANLLTYPNAATYAVVAAGADEAQAGAVKMGFGGDLLSVVVSESGALAEYQSENDGYTWAAV